MVKGNDVLSAVIAAPTWAAAAAAMGKDGKVVRTFARNVLGQHKSRGGAFDERTKRFAYARFVDGVPAATLRDAYANGDATPPVK